jgi:coatomer protein complex subunit epsilon
LTIFNAFHQAQYQKVIDFDTSSLSSENALPARILQLRAQIASGQAEEVLADVEGEDEVPDLAAVKALALYGTGNTSTAVKEIEELAATSSENATVQVTGGTVLQAAGKSEEALALLMKHSGSLEAVALIVQIHLQHNRTDLAQKEVQAARKWAQDSLLVNIAESWVGLRLGGERYQQAFYEFEEMPLCQAVAEIHLGRLPEAEAALKKVKQEDPDNVEAISNSIVLSVLSAKDPTELVE